MHRIDHILVTMKGKAPLPEVFVVKPSLARSVRKQLLEAEKRQNEKNKSIPVEEVFPEIFDPVMGPALYLKGIRSREEMTQKELAKKVGIHQHHLSEMEHGKRPIGKKLAKKLAKALNANWKGFL